MSKEIEDVKRETNRVVDQATTDVNNGLEATGMSTGGNFFEDVANSYVNSVVRIATGGDVGFRDGKFNGAPFRTVNEGIGEVTGRNQARQALNEARAAAQEEKDAKKVEISNENKRAELQDIQSSQRAYSLRASAAALRNNMLGSNGTRDFLGI